MKRFALCLLAAGLIATPCLRAQNSHAEQKSEAAKEEANSEEGMDGWKWANFILLVGVLAYFGVKLGRPYFVGQTESINQGLNEARRRREDANRRAAEVEAKLANLGADVEAFRRTALNEQAAHADAMKKQAEREMARIRANAEQQIDLAGKHARLELQQHASRIALDLAERRLREEMTPDTQHVLAGQFIDGLKAEVHQ